MEYPKISCVTVVYNGAKFLENTIKSVLGQNYPNLEYIVIDGGSTDGSVDIIKKYQEKISYWVSEKDEGMYDALQKGFSHATGDIYCWLNSDDEYFGYTFFAVAEIFSQFPEIRWLTGRNSHINEKGYIYSCSPSRKLTKYHFLLNEYKWIQQESTFWAASLYKEAGEVLSAKIKYAGDYALWLNFFQYDELCFTDIALGKFRHTVNQLSALNIDKYFAESTQVFDKVKGNIKQLYFNTNVQGGGIKTSYYSPSYIN